MYMFAPNVQTLMRTRRQILGGVVAMSVAFAGCSSSGMNGENNSKSSEGGENGNAGAGLFAPGFKTNTIPDLYTCEGGDISPELDFSDVSRETNSFAIIMGDPDAPGSEPFVHWLIWNIPPNTTTLPEGIPTRPRVELSERGIDPGFPRHEVGPALQGTNSAGEIGYTGPCSSPEDPPTPTKLPSIRSDRRLTYNREQSDRLSNQLSKTFSWGRRPSRVNSSGELTRASTTQSAPHRQQPCR
jgi:Raf kinase inhibitor-like YbhB/YbcL family protein